jgi:hypothetical protein
MSIELDHFFICTDVGAPEADRLVEIGLIEGTPNRHPGQGTASRRFFFENAFLELVWVENSTEARSDSVRRTGLWERWSGRNGVALPFGVGFRPKAASETILPFQSWEYRPPYLPAPLAIHMAENSEIATEPLLFFLSFGRRPDIADPARRQPRDHPAGVRTVTRLVVKGKELQAASDIAIATMQACQLLHLASGNENLLEVEFDCAKQARTIDLRPALPLLVRC